MDTKIRLEGAQRACSPEETIERMKPHFFAAGITRIADITGLDFIGIPVAQCVRPDAVMLAVDSGKGVTPEAARCSAMMEGFERHVGETAIVSHLYSTAVEIGVRAEWRFQLLNGASFDKNKFMRWTSANKLGSGEQVMVPEVTVRMLSRQASHPLFHACFSATSNGLSSGNTRDEAIAGGLYEIIERDQVTFSVQNKTAVQVDLTTATNSSLISLIEKLRIAKVEPVLFDCTSDIKVPTYTAYIYDRERGTGLYKGYAAHLDPTVAQCRAICEAVQARGVWRAGSRDDILHAAFQKHLNEDKPWVISTLVNSEKTVSCNLHKDLSGNTFSEDIKTLLKQISDAGLPEPLAKEFDHPYPCSVVRVLGPGMHGYHHEFGRCDKRPNYE